MTVEVAGHTVRWVADAPASTRIAELLAHHVCPGPADATPDVTIELEFEDGLRRSALSLLERDQIAHVWRWQGSTAGVAELPERFYYWVVYPTLKTCLAGRGVASVHGAIVDLPDVGGVLLVGPAGSGKSSAAASCALEGCEFLSDDTVLHDPRSGRWHGLRRPLHIHPDMMRHLIRLVGIEDARPHLPSREKLEYDWWYHFPDRRVDSISGIVAVLSSTVDADADASTFAVTTRADVREAFANELDGEVAEVALELVDNGLRHVLFGHVTWAPSVWEHDRAHLGFLADHLTSRL